MKLVCGPMCGWYDVNRWAEGSVLFNQVGPWWASVFMVSCRQMGRGKCMIQTGGPRAGYHVDRWAEGSALYRQMGRRKCIIFTGGPVCLWYHVDRWAEGSVFFKPVSRGQDIM